MPTDVHAERVAKVSALEAEVARLKSEIECDAPLLEVAAELGGLRAEIEDFETAQREQAKPIEAAALALKSVVEGLAALQAHELKLMVQSLENRVAALEARKKTKK